jgi:hypothetical protein
LVGLFEIYWKTPCHDLLLEFFNTWQEKKETIYARIGEKFVIEKFPTLVRKSRNKQINKLKKLLFKTLLCLGLT